MVASHTNKMLLFGVIGFAMGMLLAPEKGEVTRQKLKKQATDLTDKAKERKEAAMKKLDEIRGKKDRLANEMGRALDDARADTIP